MKSNNIDSHPFDNNSRLIYLPIITFCLMLCSCKCCYIIGECLDYPDRGAIFNVVEKNSLKNLLEGGSKRYKIEEIKIYGTRDTFSLNKGIDTFQYSGSGMVLEVNFLINKNKLYYISFGDGDIDTLVTELNEFENDCCNTLIELVGIKHNNFPIQSCGQHVVLLRK